MPYGRYQFSPGPFQPNQLIDEIVAGGLSLNLMDVLGDGFSGPGSLANSVICVFVDVLGNLDWQKLQNVIAAHVPVAGYVSLGELAASRSSAKNNLTQRDPLFLAARNAWRILFTAEMQNRASLLALVADYNARFGTTIAAPPAVRAWPQFLSAVQSQIDVETNPSA